MALTRPSAAQLKSTVIDFEDPLLRINKAQSGSNNKDIGIVFERGSDTNVAIIWDESADQFALISTSETGSTAGNVSISSYSDLKVGDFEAAGLSYPTSDGTNGQFLKTDGSGNLSFSSITATPAGSNTQVQYNNNSQLGASSNLTFDGTTLTSTGFSGPLTGNASTATTLETSRTIGGVSFDGSANINLPGVNATGNQDTSGNASTATTLETSRTISLTGDATGSVSFDGSSNVSITTTVADDSHNHTISNVDGLQSALDAKAALASPSLTGTPTAPTASAGTNTTQIATTAFVGTAVSNLVSSAPSTLDTLNELAAALGDDANFSTTVSNNIAGKANNTVTISAGSGLSGGGNLTDNRTISHADTSSQSSVNNSNGTVIQDITLDTYGHLTGIASANLDDRYYTETEADSRFVNVTGDTLTGTLNYRMLQNQSTSNYDTVGDSSGFSVFYGSSSATSKPSGTDHAVATFSYSDAWQTQIAMDWRTKNAYFRTQENGTWKSWATMWHSDNDGSGSGLDADTLDGVQGSSYLRSDADDTFSENLTLSKDGQDVLNFSADDTNDARGISFNNRTALSADYNDGWLRLNQLSEFSNGIYTPGGLRVDGTLQVASTIQHEGDTNTQILFDTDTITLQTAGSSEITVNSTGVRLGDTGNGYFQPVSGDYGSIQIDGGAHNGWEGYSIGGRVVFMHDNSSSTGIYNDVDNEWMARGTFNGTFELYHNGSSKLQTTSSGVSVTGELSGTASSAKYADLAENYLADQAYLIGTVLDIGGDAEVTIATANSYRIVGTVSENPGYLMNSDIKGDYITPVAYIGRVPCRVQGTIHRGDMLIVGDTPGVAVACHPRDILPGQAVGKALESFNSNDEGLIEILVGRL